MEQQRAGAGRLHVFLTGGDGGLIKLEPDWHTTQWPTMTLEGLRLTAGALEAP
jgi:hypothetical protein